MADPLGEAASEDLVEVVVAVAQVCEAQDEPGIDICCTSFRGAGQAHYGVSEQLLRYRKEITGVTRQMDRRRVGAWRR